MRISWRERLEREPHWCDFSRWPTVDVKLAVPAKRRSAFNRNRLVVARVLAGDSQKMLAAEFGLSPGRISQLMQRALGGQDDEPPLLTRGLLPNLRVQRMKRRAPLSTFSHRRGSRGAFRHLLATVPGLKDYLDRLITGFVRRHRRGQNVNPQTFQWAFIRYLRNHGWPQDTYPFTEDSQASQSTRRYLKQQVQACLLSSVSSTQEAVPEMSPLRIGQVIEIDEQTTDVFGKVGIIFNDVLEPLRLSRISLLLARDRATGAHLRYTLALTEHPGQDDVLRLLESLVQPWQPRTFSTPGLSYMPGGGFPNGLDEAACRITLGVVYLDNALAHLADSVSTVILNDFGATVNWGLVKQPKTRNVVEQAFNQLNRDIHRFPSTSGSHPQDPVAEPARHKKKAPILPLQALEEVIEVLLTNENGIERAPLGARSPLSAWQYQLRNKFIPVRPLLPGDAFKPFHVRRIVTVRKPDKEVRSPYIHFEKARYHNAGVLPAELINQQIIVEFDRRDIRTLQAYTLQGEALGTLLAPKTWLRFPHSLRTRKLINRLVRLKRIQRDDPLGAYFDYLLDHRDIPSMALRLMRLYREYGIYTPLPDPAASLNPPVHAETPEFVADPDIPEWHAGLVHRRHHHD